MDRKDSKHIRRIRRASEHLNEAQKYMSRAVACSDSNAINEAQTTIKYYENILQYYRTHHPQLFSDSSNLVTVRLADPGSVQAV